jgi:beta-galactosidase
MIRYLLSTGLIFCLLQFTAQAQQSQRLTQNWEFIRQDLGSVWEAVRPVAEGSPESVPLWENVSLPHCFNAEDAVDPDVKLLSGAWLVQSSIRCPQSV